ncbi:flagellar FlbD family protein [Aeoliella sp. SH292]|uniref:flagellar FlbD family protein n=1 Tax=Aeoliella sp. SH292 TaxID=3454464 RepID=UPI003F99DA37
MIHLTKLSGAPFVLNAELIKYVEALPDTFITLTTGEHIVVKETPEEIIHRTIDYHQHKLLMPTVASRSSAGESNRAV